MYAPWFAVAAARRMRDFVAVVASVDSSRFDVVSGVAVVAPEEHAAGFVVGCVRPVAEGDHYRSMVDVFQGGSCNQHLGW